MFFSAFFLTLSIFKHLRGLQANIWRSCRRYGYWMLGGNHAKSFTTSTVVPSRLAHGIKTFNKEDKYRISESLKTVRRTITYVRGQPRVHWWEEEGKKGCYLSFKCKSESKQFEKKSSRTQDRASCKHIPNHHAIIHDNVFPVRHSFLLNNCSHSLKMMDDECGI